MTLRGLTGLLVAALICGSAADAAAQPAKKKASPKPALVVEPLGVEYYWLYREVTDPIPSAVRDALADTARDGQFLDKRDAAAVAEFYARRRYAPVWTVDGTLTEQARAIMRRLGEAERDGLDPDAYVAPPVDLKGADPAIQASAEVMLSGAIVTYARHAYAGRLVPSHVSTNFGYEQHLPDSVAVLENVSKAADPAAALDSYNPPHPEFQALRSMLAELRAEAPAEKHPEIPSGPMLKPGGDDPRTMLLRARLGLPANTLAPQRYDDEIVAAVTAFQRAANLRADGIVGRATLAALNKTAPDPIPILLANMERWRWMPRDLGDYYVRVNVPNFNLDVYDDGAIVHTTRLVVGQVTNQTPIFSNEIDHVVVNPAWNVPASIALNEMLPAIRRNPGYLRSYQVLARVKGRYRVVNPYSINWHRVDVNKIQIRQPPGERNALGRIKFMFPNKYSVYLHDTPSKSLFERDYRAYSHGCMRVMDPMAFADVVFARQANEWSAARLKKLIGGPERRINLPVKVPVHITYFTAWVDDSGALQIRDDLYGHDAKIEKALGLIS